MQEMKTQVTSTSNCSCSCSCSCGCGWTLGVIFNFNPSIGANSANNVVNFRY